MMVAPYFLFSPAATFVTTVTDWPACCRNTVEKGFLSIGDDIKEKLRR